MSIHVAIFDLDRTLVRKTAAFSFYFYLLKKKMIPRATLWSVIFFYFQVRFFNLSIRDLQRKVFDATLKGRPLSLFIIEAKKFLDGWLERHLHPLVHQRFLEAKKEGVRTILLSCSPDFIVREIAERLQFDDWKGTEYAVDNRGELCDISSLIEGKEKLKWAEKIPCLSSVVYTDSPDDRPLLEWADKAVVVQPRLFMKRMAIIKNWEVIQ